MLIHSLSFFDVNRYALACVMWQVGSRTNLYERASDFVIEQYVEYIVRIYTKYSPPNRGVKYGEREAPLKNCPRGYNELISKCWGQISEDRPKTYEILSWLEAIRAQMDPSAVGMKSTLLRT